MDNAFGKLLREERAKARLSQQYVGQQAGLDHSFISYLESGRRKPTREGIEQIARAFRDPMVEDRLLAAAGFLPRRAAGLAAIHPVLDRVLRIVTADVPPATIAGGMHFIERGLQRAEVMVAAAYRAKDVDYRSMRPSIEVCPRCKNLVRETGWDDPPYWCGECDAGVNAPKITPLPLRTETPPDYWRQEDGDV